MYLMVQNCMSAPLGIKLGPDIKAIVDFLDSSSTNMLLIECDIVRYNGVASEHGGETTECF